MKNMKISNVVLTFIVLIGIILLVKSLDFANNLTHSWVQSLGGEVETSTYNIMLNNYINVFQISGGILFGIGGFLLLFAVFFYKD
ncbi:hypothetical protein [Bacillus mycoides]|uniref:Uncharacterized protein n=1 Tax=Bacillus mycoides TaxID=1405 RepID=A0A4U3A8K9_BACMY|nr:hypothetical protein [Bacillus mycoides]TKI83858.1 hypothetical protein FC701_16125 [Bacillus mycoides]